MFKPVNQKWETWDCPEDVFDFNRDSFLFRLEHPPLPVKEGSKELYIKPVYTLFMNDQVVFTCTYVLEYEWKHDEHPLDDALIRETILKEAYPLFLEAFNDQKKDFRAAENLPAPRFRDAYEKHEISS